MEKQEQKSGKFHQYLKIFTTTFQISAFSFGGGFAIIPLLQKKFVEDLGWLTDDEVLDLSALAQSSPGSLAVNAAMLLGYQVCGFAGAMVAMLGTVLPPLIIICIISRFYVAFRANKLVSSILLAMAAAVCAIVFDVVWSMLAEVIRNRKFVVLLMFVIGFIANAVFHVNVVYIILICGVLGIILRKIGRKIGKEII